MFEIQDQGLETVDLREHLVRNDFRGGQHEVALELVDLDSPSLGAQDTRFFGRADAARVDLSGGVLEANHGLAGVRRVEQMQIERAREIITDAKPPNAVAPAIEGR